MRCVQSRAASLRSQFGFAYATTKNILAMLRGSDFIAIVTVSIWRSPFSHSSAGTAIFSECKTF